MQHLMKITRNAITIFFAVLSVLKRRLDTLNGEIEKHYSELNDEGIQAHCLQNCRIMPPGCKNLFGPKGYHVTD